MVVTDCGNNVVAELELTSLCHRLTQRTTKDREEQQYTISRQQ